MKAPVLGFVGLGRMGGPMSGRLAAAGHQVIAFDVAGTSERLPAGAAAADSVVEVAARADTLFLSLPDGTASRAVCSQVVGAAERRARVVVDTSTIGIAAARDCAGILAAAGVPYVDAPVSGGVVGARNGTLAVMVGADLSLFEALKPLLLVIARNCFRVGGAPGQGQAMKLLNNFISATSFAATTEAVIFGARMGLDLPQMIDVLNASTGRTTASSDKFPRGVLSGTYEIGFTGALMKKDVTLFLESAEDAGGPHEIGATVAALLQRFAAACPGADFSYLHKYLEDGA